MTVLIQPIFPIFLKGQKNKVRYTDPDGKEAMKNEDLKKEARTKIIFEIIHRRRPSFIDKMNITERNLGRGNMNEK